MHGNQLGRFFHGYYGHYCFLPLYIFAGDHPLAANPRFVVTSLSEAAFDAKTLYEREYCARGEMENKIKEQQLFLFADRLSCETLRANQLRLYFSTVAYVVMRALREFGLHDTPLATAQCDTIRLQLFKIGALVRVSVRRVLVSFSESYPWRTVFAQVWSNLHLLTSAAARPRPSATG